MSGVNNALCQVLGTCFRALWRVGGSQLSTSPSLSAEYPHFLPRTKGNLLNSIFFLLLLPEESVSSGPAGLFPFLGFPSISCTGILLLTEEISLAGQGILTETESGASVGCGSEGAVRAASLAREGNSGRKKEMQVGCQVGPAHSSPISCQNSTYSAETP